MKGFLTVPADVIRLIGRELLDADLDHFGATCQMVRRVFQARLARIHMIHTLELTMDEWNIVETNHKLRISKLCRQAEDMAKEYVSGHTKHVECFINGNLFEVAIEWQCDPDDFTSTVRYEVVADIGYRFYGQPHSQPHSDRFKNFWWPAFQRVFHFDRRDELLERLKQLFQISPAVWANK